MKHFAALYAQLEQTRSTTEKVAAMRAYFAQAPQSDAAWALWFLLGNRLKRVVGPSRMAGWVLEPTGWPPALVELSYAHVGDLAETIALMLDTAGLLPEDNPGTLGLGDWVARLQSLAGAEESVQRERVLAWWGELPRAECYLFNKLSTGELRVGVSAGLAARAVAEHAGVDVKLVQHRLMGEWQPGPDAWSALLAPAGEVARQPAQPYPFCLASPLEDAPESLGAPQEFLVEWKWDGIRAQLIRRGGETFLWSRGEELLNGRFPEIESAAPALPDGTVLDGEVLAWSSGPRSASDARGGSGRRAMDGPAGVGKIGRTLAMDGMPEGGPLPFAVLQKRIGRKVVGRKTLAEAPVAFLAYDLLEWQGQDWRARPLAERRARLQELIARIDQDRLRLSSPVAAADWAGYAALRETARERRVEGFMLKRLDSPYVTGRKRGAWWKWKIGALTIDAVLVYAQLGHGRRANVLSDYTLALWDDAGNLVPVAKAYSGLTDAELMEMDAWIRAHTLEKFGPVRSVEPLQVFEIAFEGIQRSPRHKSGIAVRFPRIHRWRRDKPAAEADRLSTMHALLDRMA